ncbi:reverse transcriptase domain-containing protein [Citrus sinensis]|nr:reverse transcriptase domain-containing protein [Citrus sinensis]
MLARQVESVSRVFNFENCFAVDRTGMGSGLALLWRADVNVSITSYSSHHIDALVSSESGLRWRCTGIYGHPELSQKHNTWTLMKRLASLFSYPWCCFGDFNEIMHMHEKNGGNERNLNRVAEFREAVQSCNLQDMGCKGYPYTWSNKRYGDHLIEERLDRFLCSKDWGINFQESVGTNLVNWSSDHCPIILDFHERSKNSRHAGKSLPRDYYEDMWSSHEGCRSIVQEEWSRYGARAWEAPVQQFQRIAKSSLAQLKLWSKTEFNGRQRKQEKLMQSLQDAMRGSSKLDDGQEIKRLESQINSMLVDEEIYWKQRSRADWLREGDKNTNPTPSQIQAALQGMTVKVTPEMNVQLEKPFTAEDVEEALANMCPTKAPRPDGLPTAFFQKHWKFVRNGMISTCLNVLNEQGNPSTLNHTFIALIPKIANPRKVSDYRPISLCNVIYRVVAKAIANRMKPILSQIISPMQSVLIPNRLITDNVIIGYECLNKIRHSKGKKNGLVALKLDISKAYDRIEWPFLEQTMLKMGFPSNWVALIMRCLISTSFSVLINGVLKGMIQPKRGLRQGCPLSPYLFILCAEALSNLLAVAEQNQLIRGLKFAREVSITHLLFVDDSLVFSRASVAECMHLKEMFDKYAAASGQFFNFQKSSLFFSGKIPEHQRAAIRGWQHKMLSSGGKEVLIKATAQAIPAYAMSVFKLPRGFCDDIQVLQARYFRNSSFLCAKAGANASYIWRSIMWGRQVIMKGMRWRIGNGKKVAIFSDNWLPRPETFRLIFPPSLHVSSVVADLIKADNQWDEIKLRQHFMDVDTVEILKIPLPAEKEEDEVLWHYDKRGNYSVKSGYQLALRSKFPDSTSCTEASHKYWSSLWTLELPEKLKIFMWRASNNLLPSAENLWKRKVVEEPTCKRCNLRVETISHALLECKAARKIWLQSLFPAPRLEANSQDIFSTLQNMAKELRKSDLELMVALCWSAWYARNKCIFDGREINPIISAAKAESVLSAFQRVRKPQQAHISISLKEKQQAWLPPPQNVFKVNVDAALNSKNLSAGVGAVIRDSNEKIVAAGVNQNLLQGSASLAEAEAVLWGLQLARKADVSSLMIKSDCLEVVQLVNNTMGSRSEIFWTILAIQNQMKNFQKVVVNHIPRHCNACAHYLAKIALEKISPFMWLGNIPVDLYGIIKVL